jgi:uncharacterized protein YqjF (DUF2071 family)
MQQRPRFLTAEWRWLAMLNYRVSPQLLAPLVPAGTEIDLWGRDTFISVLAFRFSKVRMMGIPIPFHTDFDEVNLRFYVSRPLGGQLRRGVVFVKEIVPRSAVALTARAMYNEPYSVMEMKHRVPDVTRVAETPPEVEYAFRQPSRWSRITITPKGSPRRIPEASEQEFLSVRHWGYTRQRDGGTVEYRVEHPRWSFWDTSAAALDADLLPLYGDRFVDILNRPADSAYLLDGSPVSVSLPERVAQPRPRVLREMAATAGLRPTR